MSASTIRTRLLVPVWGHRYIELLCTVGLPSLLSEGNLPALARATDCEIIFLTTATSVAHFELFAAYRRLCEVCTTSFIEIDDIVGLDNYGITLTLAYARGIRSLGAGQIGTYFIFFNADFVLSENALTALAGHIQRGSGVVLAASLRCNEEDVRPLLSRLGGADGLPLRMPSRALVALVLRHLHATARASTVNQSALHHAAANQLLWRVDESTLIGRFYLLFMLCIRVDRMMMAPSGFCDYSFVPDLCPLGPRVTVTDSDELFIAELQATRGEAGYVAFGQLAPKEYAARLTGWATKDHRANAEEMLVFHANALPAVIAESRRAFDGFMGEIKKAVGSRPVPHDRHHHWVSALNDTRARFGTLPPDLVGTSLLNLPLPWRWASRVKRTLYNTPVHPRWAEKCLFRAFARRTLPAAARHTLYVSNWDPSASRMWLTNTANVRHAWPDEVIDGGLLASETFDLCVVHLGGREIAQLAPILSVLAAHMPAAYCFLDNTEFKFPESNIAADIALALPYGAVVCNFRSTGSWTRANLAKAIVFWFLEYKNSAGLRRVWPALRTIWIAGEIVAANVIAASVPPRARRRVYMSVTFECRFDAATAEARSCARSASDTPTRRVVG